MSNEVSEPDLDSIKEIIKEAATTIKSPEDLKQFWIRHGLLNGFSGELEGYGLIQIDQNGNLTNTPWPLNFQDIMHGAELGFRLSADVQQYCGDRLHDKGIPESYALYILAERDTLLLALKNSQQRGWGRRMIGEVESVALKRGSEYATAMLVRKELNTYFCELGYVPFREVTLGPIHKKCYLKRLAPKAEPKKSF